MALKDTQRIGPFPLGMDNRRADFNLALGKNEGGGAIGKAPAETWAGTVLATGNAVFFRYVGSADTGALSTTEPRLQGRVGVSGAELNISSLALTAGQTQAVNFIAISQPG